MKHINRKRLAIATAQALGALALATAAQAQQRIEKIEVTGSNIKRIDAETPSPVTVVTREHIQNSGTRDIAELLRNVSAASAGSQLDQTSNSFSNGAQTVSLRGLGSAGTLILLNGRRVTPGAYADPNTGNSTVYNLNAIPIDAIERIEILKDGASAIYGSDAMAGVVNFILRSNYNGAEASASYSQSAEGEWSSYRASATVGIGNLERDRWNFIASLEHFHRDPVNIREVTNVATVLNTALGNWRVTQSANGFPGNYFRENVLGNGNFATFVAFDANCPAGQVIANRCRYDSYRDVNISFDQDRNDAYLRGTLNLSANLTAFGEVLFSRTKSDYFSTPQFISNAGSTWGDANGNLRTYRIILPPGHPDNPTTVPVAVAYTFADLGRRKSFQTNDNTRVVLGLKGNTGAWDWETGFLHMKNEREEKNSGYISFPGLQQAVSSGAYRFNGQGNSAAVLSQVGTTFLEVGESSITSIDLRGSRELMELRGGPMAIAAGAEFRQEELKIVSDPQIVRGDILGRGTSSADGDRNITALFAELSMPFARNLETQLALRTERYSDFGNSTTPKVGIKWNPVEQWAFRGTYAKGFRAPSLSQISQSSVQAFNNGVRDPLRCPTFVSSNPDCATSFASYIRANPDLQPEKSDNYTIGMIFAPTRSSSIAVDYWSIKRKDQIDRFSATYLLANESRFPNAIVRDPNPATWLHGTPNSGPIQAVLRQFFNLNETHVSGIDVDAQWTVRTPTMGRFTTALAGTYLMEYKYAVDVIDPLVDEAGTYGGPSDALPRFRGNLSTTWDVGPWTTVARLNYVRGWFAGSGGGVGTENCFYSASQLPDSTCKVKPWTTVDLGVTWKGIRNLTLGVLVRNVFDRDAPYDPAYSLTTQTGFNPVYHNALGRYYTVNASYRFR
jgi:iron complex outermembrane recepter protein